jgi:hypothetical protein
MNVLLFYRKSPTEHPPLQTTVAPAAAAAAAAVSLSFLVGVQI